ncbi:MAG TPA: FtsX-like permease family protein [Spirochaetota bacterium]|nr:FtsX-like permease family protein [Spirochaetota bacterium]
MKKLNRKLVRDLLRYRKQTFLLIILIMCGVGIYSGLTQSALDLNNTYSKLYRKLNLSDIRIRCRPFPRRYINGFNRHKYHISNIETRLQLESSVDLNKQFTAITVGIACSNRPAVNDLKITAGRYFDSNSSRQIIVEKKFADFHKIKTGQKLKLTVGSKNAHFTVCGIAVSPEYLWYTGDPHDYFPAPGSWGIFFLPLRQLQQLSGLDSMVNNIVLTSGRPAQTCKQLRKEEFIKKIAYQIEPKEEMWSYWAIKKDLQSFNQLSKILIIISLIIVSLTLFMTLGRIIKHQQKENNILLALGVSRQQLGLYYFFFITVIIICGSLPGTVFGFLLAKFIDYYYSLTFTIPVSTILQPFIFLTALLAACCLGLVYTIFTYGWLLPRSKQHSAPAPVPDSTTKFFTDFLYLPLKIAVRNVLRNKVRFILTVSGIASALIAAFALYILFISIKYTVDAKFAREKWDYLIHFRQKTPQSLIKKIANYNNIKNTEPLLITWGQARNLYHKIVGINTNNRLICFPNLTGCAKFKGRNPLLITSRLARKLNLTNGSKLTVKIENNKKLSFVVTGIYADIMEGALFTDISYLKKAFSGRPVSGLYMQGFNRKLNNMQSIQKIIKKKTAASNLKKIIRDLTPFIYIFLFISMFTGLLIFLNTVTINTIERKKEFAVLKALGANTAVFFRIIAVEHLITGSLSALTGLLLGSILARHIMQQFSSGLFRINLHLPVTVYIMFYSVTITLLFLTTIPVLKHINKIDSKIVLKET